MEEYPAADERRRSQKNFVGFGRLYASPLATLLREVAMTVSQRGFNEETAGRNGFYGRALQTPGEVIFCFRAQAKINRTIR